MVFLMLLRRLDRADVTTHGFRSTFRDWAEDETHHPREVIEAALAHSVGNEVELAYRRGDALKKRRELMNECGVLHSIKSHFHRQSPNQQLSRVDSESQINPHNQIRTVLLNCRWRTVSWLNLNARKAPAAPASRRRQVNRPQSVIGSP